MESVNGETLEPSWWDLNISTRMKDFESWIGDHTATSKRAVRDMIRAQAYESILDCGCGLCTEYYGFKVDGYDIRYQGLDSCLRLVEIALKKGISATHGSIVRIPEGDETYDVAVARHVFEHLPGYEGALTEMIRVTRREVIAVFFHKPHAKPDCITYIEGLYHNTYNKSKLEAFVLRNEAVSRFEWVDVDDAEVILRIAKKDTRQ